MDWVRGRQRLKPWLLPAAMAGGFLFHDFIDQVAFVAPWLIFVMLLITYCRTTPSNLRLTGLSWSLLAVQIIGAVVVYLLLLPTGDAVAQGVFICLFCPTATAAPVVTGMLGGSVARVVAFSLVSNVSVALLAPLLFAVVGGSGGFGFGESVFEICRKVMPLLVVPLVVSVLLRRITPKLHGTIAGHQSLSFYIWAVTLFIVVGRAVSFIIHEPAERIPEMVLIGGCALVVCCLQFCAGRLIGRRFGDRIAGAQGLGQKNTVLAVWMALTFLEPVASVGPASYILWQNMINSCQLYRQSKKAACKQMRC